MTPHGLRKVLTSAVVVVLGALTTTALAAVPASAHGSDPTLVPVLQDIRPTLPEDVLVQVRTGLSEQMVVSNPTDVPLTITDPQDAPFMRISGEGVFGNVTSPFFHATINPPDVPPRVPDNARPGASPDWVKLATSDFYGWFEPRLHPFVPGQEPAGGRPDEDEQRREILADWSVSMTYGERPVTARGVLERRPVTGAFQSTADRRDDGLQVTVAQGQVPAVAMQAPAGRRVVVQGADGVPFLRVDEAGVAVNPASSTFRDNPQFQGAAAGPDGWLLVSRGSTTATWLDNRLKYRADRPPADVETGDDTVELDRWTIPVTVDGAQEELSGAITWVPSSAAADFVGAGDEDGFPWTTVGLGVGVVALVAVLGLALRARRRA